MVAHDGLWIATSHEPTGKLNWFLLCFSVHAWQGSYLIQLCQHCCHSPNINTMLPSPPPAIFRDSYPGSGSKATVSADGDGRGGSDRIRKEGNGGSRKGTGRHPFYQSKMEHQVEKCSTLYFVWLHKSNHEPNNEITYFVFVCFSKFVVCFMFISSCYAFQTLLAIGNTKVSLSEDATGKDLVQEGIFKKEANFQFHINKPIIQLIV